MKNTFVIKLISLLLIAVFMLGATVSCSKSGKNEPYVVPERVNSDSTIYTSGLYEYYLYEDNTAVIYAYTGEELNVNVPNELDGYKVVEIAPAAFQYNRVIQTVTLGEDLEVIGEGAFYSCRSLKSVKIGPKVRSIGPGTFDDTAYNETLTDEFVIVGDSLLLKYCGTDTNVTIPDTVKHIGPAFNSNQTVVDVTMGDSVVTVGSGAFVFSTVRRVTVGNNVVLIDMYAFQGCDKLRYVNIPDSVKRISYYAFYGCTSLKSLYLGKGVETISDYAFYQCSQLNYINLPKSLKTIGDFAFKDCYKLLYVYYEGSEADYEALGITGTNHVISDAKKFYNYNYEG